MIPLSAGVRTFVFTGATDIRKSFNGLSGLERKRLQDSERKRLQDSNSEAAFRCAVAEKTPQPT